MPTSVHKILIHGAAVIKESLLPIGELSEEAQEAKNKQVRRFRECHTRKCSRLQTNEDLFKRLLLSSDPFISNFYKECSERYKNMNEDMKNLLILDESLEEKEGKEEDDDDEESEEEKDNNDEEVNIEEQDLENEEDSPKLR
nr:probable ATP-dependent RNA helicase ddx56 [Onthophagus taurus]